jgi:hypothetical protein
MVWVLFFHETLSVCVCRVMTSRAQSTDGSALVLAIVQGESDNAMYWTCMCLGNGNHAQLEDAWIEVTARIGARQVMPFKETWAAVNRALLEVLKADALHVSDAIAMTGMLYLLYHRTNAAGGAGSAEHFSKLRKEILDFFPEGAMLSYRGQQQFARILSHTGSETHAFMHRVLAGLGRLLEKEDSLNLHRALEYISRKKVQLKLPHVWPAPSTQLADKGDPVWFLWGAMLCLLPNDAHVATLWELYQYNWRTGAKTARAGLLWGVAHMLQAGVGYVWRKEELDVLERARGVAPELWASIREVEGIPEDEGPAKGSRGGAVGDQGGGGLDILARFVPRGLSGSGPAPHAATHGTYDPAPRILRIGIKESPKNNSQGELHEASRSDPRYRWLDFGSKRP